MTYRSLHDQINQRAAAIKSKRGPIGSVYDDKGALGNSGGEVAGLSLETPRMLGRAGSRQRHGMDEDLTGNPNQLYNMCQQGSHW